MDWYCSHSMAHFGAQDLTWGDNQDSCSLSIPNNLNGSKIRITFANRYGTEPFVLVGAWVAKGEEQEVAVSFEGKESVTIAPRSCILCDELAVSVEAGDVIRVRMQFANAKKPYSGFQYEGEMKACYEALDVYCANKPKVVVGFGDSITWLDVWTAPLREYFAKKHKGEAAVSNRGISGNRFLRDSIEVYEDKTGDAGIHRFQMDALDVAGVSHVIFALGTNDLGHPGHPITFTEGMQKAGFFGPAKVPYDQLPTAEQFITALKELTDTMKAHGIVSIGTTILPRRLHEFYTPEKDAIRLQINDWIKTSGAFDVVIDWADFVKKEDGTDGLKPEYDTDGLHPSAVGGKAMAEYLLERYSFELEK